MEQKQGKGNGASRIRRALLTLGAVVALSVSVTVTFVISPSWTSHEQGNREAYETAVGQERTANLCDGSWVLLYPETVLQAHCSHGATEVSLLQGRVLFNVKHDTARVFQVAANRAQVRDLGTIFEIAHERPEVTVAVLEGKVEVTTSGVHAGRAKLREGQKLRVLEAGQLFLEPQTGGEAEDPPRVSRIFKDQGLAEVTDAFNRSNLALRFVVEGAAREYQVSGSFKVNHPEVLLKLLRNDANLRVRVQGKIVFIEHIMDL